MISPQSYISRLETVLLEYVERFGLTPAARELLCRHSDKGETYE